jgi:anti-anti-sigma factor
MELSTRKEKGAVVASVNGRIDAVTSSDLEKYLVEAVAGDEKTLIVNLNELDYISSAGLRVILVIAKQLKAKQGEFMLAGLQDRVNQVFESSGIHSILRIFDTEEDALEQL